MTQVWRQNSGLQLAKSTFPSRSFLHKETKNNLQLTRPKLTCGSKFGNFDNTAGWTPMATSVAPELMCVFLHSFKEQEGAQTYVSPTITVPFLATSWSIPHFDRRRLVCRRLFIIKYTMHRCIFQYWRHLDHEMERTAKLFTLWHHPQPSLVSDPFWVTWVLKTSGGLDRLYYAGHRRSQGGAQRARVPPHHTTTNDKKLWQHSLAMFSCSFFFSVITHITVINNTINDNKWVPVPPTNNQGALTNN